MRKWVELLEKSYGTDVGRVRAHNEDWVTSAERPTGELLIMVADGMGGHQAGDVASRMACEELVEAFHQYEGELTEENAAAWLKKEVENVNETLFVYQANNPDYSGMGTTLTAAVCTKSFFSYVNVGDSRLYYMRNKQLEQVTKDHSLVGELVRQGELTEAEAEVHPRKNVLLRALGTESDIKSDTGTIHWKEREMIFLCSDGLSNKIGNEDISRLLLMKDDIHKLTRDFIEEANFRGGEDNITAAIVRNSSEDVNQP